MSAIILVNCLLLNTKLKKFKQKPIKDAIFFFWLD